MAWAEVYLERGGLLESPQRRPLHGLAPEPRSPQCAAHTNRREFLAQHSEFREFQKAKRQTEEPTTQLIPPDIADAETPEEELEAAHGRMEEHASSWICF